MTPNKQELSRWISLMYKRQNNTKLIKITEEKSDSRKQ